MSLDLIVAVFHTVMPSYTDKLVMLALAEHAWNDGTNCRPSVQRLATYCAMDRRTVQRRLRYLEATGWIKATREASRYDATEYWIDVDRLWQGRRADAPQGRRIDTPGAALTTPGAALSASRGGAVPPEPIEEPLQQPIGEPKNLHLAPAKPSPGGAAWDGYSRAYLERYRVLPVRNARVNGQLKLFASRVPAEEAEAIAAAYVGNNALLYVRAGHPVNLLLRDAEKLRTEWATGHRITESAARAGDQRQETGDMARRLIDKAERQRREHDAGA